jgi:hypothetical protein
VTTCVEVESSRWCILNRCRWYFLYRWIWCWNLVLDWLFVLQLTGWMCWLLCGTVILLSRRVYSNNWCFVLRRTSVTYLIFTSWCSVCIFLLRCITILCLCWCWAVFTWLCVCICSSRVRIYLSVRFILGLLRVFLRVRIWSFTMRWGRIRFWVIFCRVWRWTFLTWSRVFVLWGGIWRRIWRCLVFGGGVSTWTVAVTSITYPFTRVTVRCSGEGRDEFFYNFDFFIKSYL